MLAETFRADTGCWGPHERQSQTPIMSVDRREQRTVGGVVDMFHLRLYDGRRAECEEAIHPVRASQRKSTQVEKIQIDAQMNFEAQQPSSL